MYLIMNIPGRFIRYILLFIILTLVYSSIDDNVEWSDADRSFMKHAIDLASRALGQASPNPCVGCVIVDDNNNIVGEGWHEKAGEPHAEVIALQNAGNLAKDATAYVTLEPCNHFGRTPPCTQALLNSSIKRVVVGMVDPDPRVSGSGLKYLMDSGIKVDLGLDGEICKDLNKAFVFRVLQSRPFVTILYNNYDDKSTEDYICDYINSKYGNDIDSIFIDDFINHQELIKKLCSKLPSYISLITNNNIEYKNGERIININEKSLDDCIVKIGSLGCNSLLTLAESSSEFEKFIKCGSLQRLIMTSTTLNDFTDTCKMIKSHLSHQDDHIKENRIHENLLENNNLGENNYIEIGRGKKAVHVVTWKQTT